MDSGSHDGSMDNTCDLILNDQSSAFATLSKGNTGRYENPFEHVKADDFILF